MTGTKPLLFTPISLGSIDLEHRVVMAPLTRKRALENGVPPPHAIEYYAQRASKGGLIISEGTIIAAEAGGMSNVPGIYSPEQIAVWKQITDGVHAKGGKIVCQLWAHGRVADPTQTSTVWAPSDLPFFPEGADQASIHKPTPMSIADIDRFVGHYRQAAINAIEAGFDGVELHGANGYLIDQFLQTNSNNRTDEYGGSVENRLRFPLRILEAVCSAIGPDRTGIRMSPFSTFQGMRMESPLDTFLPWAEAIAKRNVAYIHAVEPRAMGSMDTPEHQLKAEQNLNPIRAMLNKANVPFIVAGGYTPESAIKHAEETGDLVAFGRFFIPNPDLPSRIENGWPLEKYNRATFYTNGVEGYTDYPPYTAAA